MTPLESHKQLLLAESELNRAQLAKDLETLASGLRSLTHRAKSFGSKASSVAVLVAGLAACQQGRPESPVVKPSRLRTFLRAAGLISTLWLALRSQDRNQLDT